MCLKRKRALTRSLEPGRSGDPIRRSGSATTTAKHPRCRVASGAQPAGGPRPTRGCRRALPRPPPWAAGGLRRAAGTRTGPDQAVIARECQADGTDRARSMAWSWTATSSTASSRAVYGLSSPPPSRPLRGPAPGGSEHGLRRVHAWSKVGDRRKARHPIGVPATRSASPPPDRVRSAATTRSRAVTRVFGCRRVEAAVPGRVVGMSSRRSGLSGASWIGLIDQAQRRGRRVIKCHVDRRNRRGKNPLS